jgi:hypothetical protein
MSVPFPSVLEVEMIEFLAGNFKMRYSYFHSYALNMKLVMLYENCGMIELSRRGLNQEAVVSCYVSFPLYRFSELRKLARNLNE